MQQEKDTSFLQASVNLKHGHLWIRSPGGRSNQISTSNTVEVKSEGSKGF